MKKNIFSKKIIIHFLLFNVFFLSSFLFFASYTQAQSGSGILPEATGCWDIETNDEGEIISKTQVDCPNNYTGEYALSDFMQLAVNISRWILGIVGSLTLLMFFWGGFMFLISSGSSEKIDKAKKIMISAVIGLIIVFGSFLIIQWVITGLGGTWDGSYPK